MTLLGQVDSGYTTTPWYVSWMPEYNEIHIQSAPEESDNHVLSIHYRHTDECYSVTSHPDICDTDVCVGLHEAMANAKLIVQSVNEKTGSGDLLINQELFREVGI